MSKEAAELLEKFKELPDREKRIFTAQFFRMSLPFDSCPIEDEDIGQAGAFLVQGISTYPSASHKTPGP